MSSLTPPRANADRLVPVAVLLIAGAGWGLATPLTKIAVSEGYKHFGLIFWQLAITGTLLTLLTLLRGQRLPCTKGHLRLYVLIAFLGTILPNSASYAAAAHLPGGVLAILLSTVPLFAFPVAIALGNDRFEWLRALGLLFGLACVVLIMAPEASLPEAAVAAFIPLALVAPFFYGIEGNLLARWGTRGLNPVQLLAGAALVGVPISGAMALATGQFIDPRGPWGPPDLALIGASLIHAVVYATYFWLVGRAGPVFAAQVAYPVTGFGVAWSIVLLGESYSAYVWAGLALMLIGIFLVQPRPEKALAAARGIADYGRRS
ncbi:MAG: DMT family transporter [Roseovarius sp.]